MTSATTFWTLPRDVYLSWVIETFAGPRRSAATRADSPLSSSTVATVLRKRWEVTSSTPRSVQALRHCLLKMSGSRHPPAVDGKSWAYPP